MEETKQKLLSILGAERFLQFCNFFYIRFARSPYSDPSYAIEWAERIVSKTPLAQADKESEFWLKEYGLV